MYCLPPTLSYQLYQQLFKSIFINHLFLHFHLKIFNVVYILHQLLNLRFSAFKILLNFFPIILYPLNKFSFPFRFFFECFFLQQFLIERLFFTKVFLINYFSYLRRCFFRGDRHFSLINIFNSREILGCSKISVATETRNLMSLGIIHFRIFYSSVVITTKFFYSYFPMIQLSQQSIDIIVESTYFVLGASPILDFFNLFNDFVSDLFPPFLAFEQIIDFADMFKTFGTLILFFVDETPLHHPPAIEHSLSFFTVSGHFEKLKESGIQLYIKLNEDRPNNSQSIQTQRLYFYICDINNKKQMKNSLWKKIGCQSSEEHQLKPPENIPKHSPAINQQQKSNQLLSINQLELSFIPSQNQEQSPIQQPLQNNNNPTLSLLLNESFSRNHEPETSRQNSFDSQKYKASMKQVIRKTRQGLKMLLDQIQLVRHDIYMVQHDLLNSRQLFNHFISTQKSEVQLVNEMLGSHQAENLKLKQQNNFYEATNKRISLEIQKLETINAQNFRTIADCNGSIRQLTQQTQRLYQINEELSLRKAQLQNELSIISKCNNSKNMSRIKLLAERAKCETKIRHNTEADTHKNSLRALLHPSHQTYFSVNQSIHIPNDKIYHHQNHESREYETGRLKKKKLGIFRSDWQQNTKRELSMSPNRGRRSRAKKDKNSSESSIKALETLEGRICKIKQNIKNELKEVRQLVLK